MNSTTHSTARLLCRATTARVFAAVLGALLQTAAFAQPAHNAFDQRRVIEGAPIVFADTNRGASANEAAEPNHSGDPAQPASASIWYSWRATEPGLVLIDLAGSNFDTALGLYEGKGFDALRTLAQNNDASAGVRTSRVLYPVEGGADYQIAVAGIRGATGDVQFLLRIVTAPEIVLEPDDVTANYGETVNFRARVMGVPPLRYQWYFNGTPIPGRAGESTAFEPTFSISLNDVTEANEGSYWIEVSNDRATRSSRRARLNVSFAPRITQQPTSRGAGSRQDVTFSVRAVGRPPLVYRWQKNGTDIPGADAQDFTLRSVRTNDNGAYRAIVTNAWGSVTSDNANLTVSVLAPTFTRHPAGITNIVGTRIELTVAVDGSQPMTLQWLKDGAPLDGETAANLLLASAQVGDTGTYSVRAANEGGTRTSQTARVRILVPPPNDDFVNAYSIVRTNYPVLETGYNVGATREASEPGHDGPPAAQSVWWKWKAPARGLASIVFTNTTFNPRLGVYTGATLPELQDVPYRTPLFFGTLYWLTDPDTDYSMAFDRAAAATGDLSFYFSFTTNLAGPLILSPPVAKTVLSCGELVLQVVATNQPTNLRYPLTYQWQFNGVDIPGATDVKIRVPSAQREHAGLYGVRVTNYGGSTNSVPVRCDVKVGPQFTIQPSDLNLRLCDNSQLRALGDGCPPITYQWLFNSTPIPGATTATFNLPNVDVTAAGQYSVVISNIDGENTSRVALVRVDPSPRITSDTLNNATVRECAAHAFQITADTTCRPLTYQWFFNRTNPIPDATASRLQLSNVQTNQQGDYSIVVYNLYTATTSRVARLTVSALPIIPGNQPEDRRRVRLGDSFSIRVAPQSCTPMTYRWLFNGDPSLPGISNLVTVTNITATATNIAQVPMLAGIDGPELTFTRPSTNLSGRYRVEVRNSAGLATSRDAIIEILEPPPNDHFRNRIAVPGTNTTVTGHDVIATREPDEPTHVTGQRWDRSIWWTWTAPEDDGYLSVDCVGSTYDTLLALYSGESLASLQRLASDDNGGGNNTSRTTGLAILAGSQIHIAVDGKNNAEGSTRVRVVFNADTKPPLFTSQPKSVAVLPGGTARFEIAVAPSPRMQFQWQHDGVNLPGQTNSVLVVSNVQLASEGAYVCLARNKYGTTPSLVAWLTTGAIVRGMVTDATNKRPIPFARVSVGEGTNGVFSLTDTNGNYELIGARPGTIRADFDADRRVVGLLDDVQFFNLSSLDTALLACTATNYYRYEDRHYIVMPGGIVTNSFSLSPILLNGLRFVLNWGVNPADLDIHVRTPRIGGTSYEIDYRNRYTNSGDNPPYGQLDADERRSFGPETVTIGRFVAGSYQLFVQKFDPNASGELTSSQATVKVYDNSGLLRVVDVPKSGRGRFWHVLNVDGASREIIVVNRIVDLLPPPTASPGLASVTSGTSNGDGDGDASGGNVSPVELLVRRSADRRPALQATTQVAYTWDFGDSNRLPSATATDTVPHRYPRPGVFTVALGMSAIVNGSNTNTVNIRTNFITVTNDPPRVRITSPATRSILRLGTAAPVTATATDSDGKVTEVAFFANGRRLSADTTAPYSFEWTPVDEEIVTLTAEATDNHGARGVSEPVLVSTRDLWGDVLIVRNTADPEIDRMKELCEEVRCIKDRALTVRILDRHELTFDLMKTFRLIIWNHLAATHDPLTADEIALFKRCLDFGIPHYFIGEDLAAMSRRLEPAAIAPWAALSHLTPGSGKLGPAILESAIPGGHHEILYSAHAEFKPFRYGGNFDAATADTLVDVVLTANGAPALLAFPSSNADTRSPRRTVTQNFRVLDPSTGSPEETQRHQLFRSAVAWLIQCPSCPQSDLQMSSIVSTNDVPRPGQALTLNLILRHSGACDPTGVTVTTFLPPGSLFVSSVPSDSVRDGDSVIFRLGRMPNGFETNLALTVVPTAGGQITFRACASGNSEDSYPGDDCRELTLDLGSAPVPPRLTVSRVGASVRIDVLGPTTQTYVLEESADLRTWSPVASAPQTTADGVFFLETPAAPSRVYRARVP